MKEIKKGTLLISTPNILGDLYFNKGDGELFGRGKVEYFVIPKGIRYLC